MVRAAVDILAVAIIDARAIRCLANKALLGRDTYFRALPALPVQKEK
jgi:hypothetical protein